MTKQSTNANEKELSYKGCYGARIAYAEMDQFLLDCFHLNRLAEKRGDERFATCIYGHAGLGKTCLVKQFKNKPVEFNGVKYPGYQVYDVPIAQFEEMGDLHGLPEKHVFMKRSNGKVHEQWVPLDIVGEYKTEGWEIDYGAGVRTMYAPPDWVPTSPGPTILLLDDWNRASIRIIKGIMQLLQNYGMVSWKLPHGCNIVLTGNPDEQDYLVTSIDAAILTRIRSVTLVHDAKEWSVWATAQGLDPRGINWVLAYPEMMIGKERTNPRTLSEFFRFLKGLPSVQTDAEKRRFNVQAQSLLDEETVTSMTVFFDRDVELIVEPEQILAGDQQAFKHIKGVLSRKEKRIDIVSITCDRLYAHIVQPNVQPETRAVKNFQDFICMAEMEEDIRHNLCMRIGRVKDGGKTQQWILGNDQLKKLILDVL
jgi:GTPase SAR1 family protein